MAGVFALYAPTLGHRFLWDDSVQIVTNRAVTDGAPLESYFFDPATTSSRPDYNTRIYRPLRNLAFRGIARVAGVHPLYYELANVALYGIATVLVLLLVRTFTFDQTAAFLAVALWAAAPIHVEAVAYPSALGDQLSLVLELSAILCALAALAARRPRALALGIGATVLCFASMLAKEMAVTEVGLLALCFWGAQVGWRTASPRRRRAVTLLTAHTLVTVGYLALRTAVLRRVGQDPVTLARTLAGIREAPVRLLTYARLALSPLGHRPTYLFPTPSTALVLLCLGICVAVAVAAARTGRSPLALGLSWFVVALVPVLHLVPLWADLADRFALVPSVGLALVVAWAFGALPLRARRWGVLATAAALLLFCAGTLVEGRAWRSDEALWSRAVADEPMSPMAHANLGTVLLSQQRPAAALRELDRAGALGHDSGDLALHRALALDALGRSAEAETTLDRALATNPENGRAHALRGLLLLRRGRRDEARQELAIARRQDPLAPLTRLLAASLGDKAPSR